MPSLGKIRCRWPPTVRWRQEQPLPDLLIAQAVGGEHRDLVLLRRERNAISFLGAGSGLPGRAELASGPGGPWTGAEAFEGAERGRQVPPCFGGGLAAPQPFAVGELNPGQVKRPAVGAGNGEGFLE